MATDLGRDYLYPYLIKTAKDYDDFCLQIRKALSENSDELVKKRKEVAKKNSWTIQVRKMLQTIENHDVFQ